MKLIKTLSLILSILLLGFIFSSCGKKKVEVANPDANAVHVEVALAVQEDFPQFYRASGAIEPLKSAEVSPDVAGKIVKLLAQEGSNVKKGQVLVQLDDGTLSAQYDQAKAALKFAEANLEKARAGVRPQELVIAQQAVQQAKVTLTASTTDLMRTENLYKAGVATKQEVDGANVRVKLSEAQYKTALENLKLAEEGARKEDKQAAEAGYDQAKATVELVKDQLEKTRIKSPIAGVITKKYHEVGEMVMPGVPVFRVETVTPMKAVLRIPQEDAGQIRVGQLTAISLPTNGIVTGKVSLVSPVVEQENRSFKIEVNIENPKGVIRSGMFIRADILLNTFKDAIIIPRAAVQKSADGKTIFVYVVQDNLAKRTPVSIGLVQDDKVIIEQGVTAGTTVVIRGAERLTDNTKVKI
ncbi:MAG: efflux RND transporter periplasmic adaptor subunit [bacterium]|nr:efflux RND transporter periplasmic adaptor subunit [bacterium]